MEIAQFRRDTESGATLLEKLFTKLKKAIFDSLSATNTDDEFFATQFTFLAAKSSRKIKQEPEAQQMERIEVKPLRELGNNPSANRGNALN